MEYIEVVYSDSRARVIGTVPAENSDRVKNLVDKLNSDGVSTLLEYKGWVYVMKSSNFIGAVRTGGREMRTRKLMYIATET
jgi:hypothetical protein